MAKKAKQGRKKTNEKRSSAGGLWIAQKNNLKGPTGERGWGNRPGGPPSNNRFLELADVALGLKEPIPKKNSFKALEKSGISSGSRRLLPKS